jgi:hypothetical protein
LHRFDTTLESVFGRLRETSIFYCHNW